MKKAIVFPIVVIISGIIIAAGVFYSRQEVSVKIEIESTNENRFEIKPVTINDHILGDPNADIIIIEYADFECPFCADFHPIMKRIIDEYAKSGRVAWVYRHFPLEKVHPNSKNAAIASECVADVLGKGSFWNFTDMVYSDVPNSLSPENLKKIAVDLGITEEDYNGCISSGKFEEKIQKDIEDGMKLYEYDPNLGTPYSILIAKNGFQTTINGAQHYTILKEIIEQNSFAL